MSTMRLVTRPDMDGLACAVLIFTCEEVSDLSLVHPQEITERRFGVRDGDILANLPYDPACAKWFDHHQHTANPAAPPSSFEGAYGPSPSAARLVYEYYGGKAKLGQFDELVRETDRVDSADLSREDVLDPQGYIRLGFTLDGRTGLGPVDEYFLQVLDLLIRGKSIHEVLGHPQVAERCRRMRESDAEFLGALEEHSRLEGNVVVTDFRSLDSIPVGNRFMIYAMYPEANVSVRLHWGPRRESVVAAIGHSIFNRGCKVDVGELAARYGGGGHPKAASVPLIDEADFQLKQIIAELDQNRGPS